MERIKNQITLLLGLFVFHLLFKKIDRDFLKFSTKNDADTVVYLGVPVHQGLHGVSGIDLPEHNLQRQHDFDDLAEIGNLHLLVDQIRREDPSGRSLPSLGLRIDQFLILNDLIEKESRLDEIHFNGNGNKGIDPFITPYSVADLWNNTDLGMPEPVLDPIRIFPVSTLPQAKPKFGRTLTAL